MWRGRGDGRAPSPHLREPRLYLAQPFLAEKHELTMCTKGDRDEQNRKIDNSGLRHLFAHCAVVKEKTKETYQQLADVRGFDPERTWMIGNSPKSDINPALSAGLNAVFVPHGNTWILEHDEVAAATPPSRLLTVETFGKLREHF